MGKIEGLIKVRKKQRKETRQGLLANEKFDSYNGILHNASIHSNRLSSGREIGITFRNYHIIRLLLSGTYFLDPTTSECVQASPLVQEIFSKNKKIQKSLGFHAGSLTDPPLTTELNNHKVEERHRKPVPNHLKQTYPKNIIDKFHYHKYLSYQEKYQPNQSVSIGCVESMWEIIPPNVFYAEMNVFTKEGFRLDYQMNMISKTYKYRIIPIEVSINTSKLKIKETYF
ncbi:hypothetical protein VP01_3766g4, partial [Puccinia sorghi]